MISIKNLFLLLLMFNTINVFTMDPATKIVKNICCTIDADLLKINKHHCFRSFSSALLSYYNTIFLPKKTAQQLIQKIESYLPRNYNRDKKKKIFEELIEKHWYVHYLIHILINKKIKKFENVKGSTVDLLLFPDFTDDINGIQEIIHTQAYTSFLNRTGINNPIVDMPCTEYTDIQFTILSGHTNAINSSSLIMSLDSNYLKSQAINGKTIIWDINKKEQIQLNDDITIWANGEIPSCMSGALDKEWQFFAISTDHNARFIHELSIKFNLPLKENSIFLVKKIQTEGYLCRLALANSFYNKEDLTTLINSNSFKAIDGFPQNHLSIKINTQLTILSS
jgi:hypothetical protein